MILTTRQPFVFTSAENPRSGKMSGLTEIKVQRQRHSGIEH